MRAQTAEAGGKGTLRKEGACVVPSPFRTKHSDLAVQPKVSLKAAGELPACLPPDMALSPPLPLPPGKWLLRRLLRCTALH